MFKKVTSFNLLFHLRLSLKLFILPSSPPFNYTDLSPPPILIRHTCRFILPQFIFHSLVFWFAQLLSASVPSLRPLLKLFNLIVEDNVQIQEAVCLLGYADMHTLAFTINKHMYMHTHTLFVTCGLDVLTLG